MRNAFVSVLMFVLMLMASFVNRTVFLRVLSVEYQGISSTLQSILSFLSLSELGIGSAVSFALYEPLLRQDIQKTKSLMRLYRNCYRIIGTVIFILGMMLMPFLPSFMKEIPEGISIASIRIWFGVYILNTAVTYFLSYKKILIICDQRGYIAEISHGVKRIITTAGAVIVLITTRSFFWYLVMMVCCTVLECLWISSIADHLYMPYLHGSPVKPLPAEERKGLWKNVTAILMHNIGTVVVFSSDSLIISRFIGVLQTGLYANYTLIISTLENMIKNIFLGTTASLGNLMAEEDAEHGEDVFYHLLFANVWSHGWLSVCLLCLTEPFIRLWLGESFIMSRKILIMAVLSFYLTGVRTTVLIYKSATGVFWQDRYKTLIESVVNIGVSIPLAIRFGIAGILAGTVFSTLAVSFWFEARVLFREMFQKGIGKYLIRQLFYFFFNVTIVFLCIRICSMIHFSGAGEKFLSLIVKWFICLVVPNVVYFFCFRKTEDLEYFRQMIYAHLPWKKNKAQD